MMSQVSFNFGFDNTLRDDDFIVSESNSAAVSLIEKWPNWGLNIALLFGTKSSGKTHLTRIWQNKSGAEYISATQIYSNNYSTDRNYILDDIEKVHDEAALLHFFNSMKEAAKGYLLMTASNHPANTTIRLPDMKSRLHAIPSVGILAPDDELLKTVFVKQFTDRQLNVEIDVINYLVTRVERSFKAACELVDLLDKQALKEKKNITIPFVKSVLKT